MKPYTLEEIAKATAVQIDGVKFYKEKQTALNKSFSADIGRFWAATVRVGELNTDTEYVFTAFAFQAEKPNDIKNSYKNFSFEQCDPAYYRDSNEHYVDISDVSYAALLGGWQDSKADQEDFAIRCANERNGTKHKI